MDYGDAPKFAQIISALAIATRAEIDEPTIHLYFRALMHCPLNLLERAAVNLASSAKFMPKPAEWLEAVDRMLDDRDRGRALTAGQQPALPGDVGTWTCPDCENTGWVVGMHACHRERCVYGPDPHEHSGSVRCTNETCIRQRELAAAKKKRYSKKTED